MAQAGVFSAAGVRTERTEYGIPEAVSCDRQIHLISESFTEQSSVRSVKVSGDLELRLAYGGGGLQHLLSTVLYSHLDKSPLDLGGGLYLHYFEFDQIGRSRNATVWDSASPSGKFIGRRATVFVDRAGQPVEVVAFQPKNLSFDIGESARIVAAGDALKLNTNTEHGGSGLCFTYTPVGLLSIVQGEIRIFALHTWYYSTDNWLTITEDGAASSAKIIIPAGTYRAVQLARMIEKQLNASPDLGGRYSVLWEGDILNFVIRSTVKFSIDFSGISGDIGFGTTTSYAYVHRSHFPARPNYIDDTGIELKASDISITLENGSERNREVSGAWEVAEAYQAKLPTARMTINLHRTEIADVGELAGEYFTVKASFTHPDGVGKMVFVLPYAKLTTPEAPVSGEQIIRERLAFESEDTEFHEFHTFFDERFMIRELPLIGGGVSPYSVHSYRGKLHVADGAQGFHRIEDSGYISLPGTGDPVSAMATYDEKLYLGTETGDLYAHDGSTTTIIGSMGYKIVAMQPFAGKLYILLSNSNVYHYDGTTLAQDTSAPAANVGWDMLATDGKLFTRIRTSSETVYSFDGSTWSLAYNFLSTENTGSLVRLGLRKRIVAIAGNKGAYVDLPYSGWTGYPTYFTEEIKHAVQYGSELLLISTTGKLYWRHQMALSDTFLGTLGTTPHYKPVEFKRKVIVPIDNQLRYIQIPYIFHMTLQDKTWFNPYL